MLAPKRMALLGGPLSTPTDHRVFSRCIRKALYIFLFLWLSWLVCNKGLSTVGLDGSNLRSYTDYQLVSSGSSAKQKQEGGDGIVREFPQHHPIKQSQTDEEEEFIHQVVPDVLRIPFEDAVRDVRLDGWEDEWFSSGSFDAQKEGPLEEPRIDFVYNWVNGSEEAFNDLRRGYELKSPLNDADGKWISQHSINRYRDWDELKYSLRSLDTYARGLINKIQILVNSVNDGDNGLRPQRPIWLKDDEETQGHVEVLSQESFFNEWAQQCLPVFDSVSIESQIHMTPSSTDQLVALSDDMFLGMTHAPSDFFSPLFGSVMAFKSDEYNVRHLGSKDRWPSFGEKPFLYYTSYLLNHRFGERNRKAQAHFSHSISRAVMKEAMASFPAPSAKGACERFRGESRAQIYPWFTSFHYSIERFREALIWSFIMSRSDTNSDGYLDWTERQHILEAMAPGRRHHKRRRSLDDVNRERMYYKLPEILRNAGLQPPRVNVNILWTSLDGPETIRKVKCVHFNVDKCFGESFGSPLSDTTTRNPDFTAANVFSRLSMQEPGCGDCMLKFLLSSTPRGLEPLLPPKSSKHHDREIIIKALKKYQHTVVDADAMKFVMVKDAEQAKIEVLERSVERGKVFGQWCFNDDVMTESEEQVGKVKDVMTQVFEGLWPRRGRWEKEYS